MSWLYRVLAIGVLISLLTLGYRTWSVHQQGIGEARATATYNLAVDQQKIQAGAALARETGKTRAAEQSLQNFKNEQEIRDAKNKTIVSGLSAQLRAAASLAGRLRDPNAAPAGCGGSGGGAPGADSASTGGGDADVAEAGGLFSAEASGLFQQLTREADEVNVAYASCRADSFNLREVLQ